MTRYRYERLSALDNFFLTCESPTTPMHVGSIATASPCLCSLLREQFANL